MFKSNKKALSMLLILSMVFSMVFISPVMNQPVQATGITYYVSTSGNDNNSGTDPNNPWQTLTKVSQQTFTAGDNILLKCGDTWSGQELVLKNDGTASSSNWVTIASYSTGNKPVITSPSGDTDPNLMYTFASPLPSSFKIGIKIKNYAGFKIKDISITNADYGILVWDFDSSKTYDGIWIENYDANNITGAKRENDSKIGLYFSEAIFISGVNPYPSAQYGLIKNVTIKDCVITNMDEALNVANINGLLIDGVYSYGSHYSQFCLLGGIRNGIVQNCTLLHAGYPNKAGDAFFFGGCTNVILRDSEIGDVYQTGGVDGVAIDYEGICKNTTVTRCYLHDTFDAAFLIMEAAWSMKNNAIKITDNVIERCGTSTELDNVAFANIWTSNSKDNYSGTISGNKIALGKANQYLTRPIYILVPNDDFEWDIPAWTTTGSAEINTDPNYVYENTRSMRLPQGATAVMNIDTLTPYTDGYYLDAYSRFRSTGGSGDLTLECKDANNNTLPGGTYTITLNSDPNQFSYNQSYVSPPTGTVKGVVTVRNTGGAGAPDVYADAVRVFKAYPDYDSLPLFNINDFPADYTVSNNTIYSYGTPIPFTTPPPVAQSNIAPGATVTASSWVTGSDPNKAKDGTIGVDGSGEWKSNDTLPWIQLTWDSAKTIDRIRLFDRRSTSSDLRSGILTFSDGSNVKVYAGIKSNGEMREVTFPSKTVTWVKFTATKSSGTDIGLSEMQVFQAYGTVPQGQMSATATSQQTGYEASKAIDGDSSTMWHNQFDPNFYPLPQSITLNLGGTYNVNQVRYLPRQDGGDNGIITQYKVYTGTDPNNFTLAATGTWADDTSEKYASFTSTAAKYIKLEAITAVGGYASAAEINVDYTSGTVQQGQMSATATSQETGYEASKAIDANNITMWHNQFSQTTQLPQSITLNLGSTYNVNKVRYLPRQDGGDNGIITDYNIYTSTDGVNFTIVSSGTWADDTSEKSTLFTPTAAKYIKLEAITGHGRYSSAAEINVDYTN